MVGGRGRKASRTFYHSSPEKCHFYHLSSHIMDRPYLLSTTPTNWYRHKTKKNSTKSDSLTRHQPLPLSTLFPFFPITFSLSTINFSLFAIVFGPLTYVRGRWGNNKQVTQRDTAERERERENSCMVADEKYYDIMAE